MAHKTRYRVSKMPLRAKSTIGTERRNSMTLHGKIHNGMVVFDSNPELPEGTPVMVLVEQQRAASSPPKSERLSDEELRRRKAILDEIASLPNEYPGDAFSGRDHDQVLYGEP